MSSPSICKRCGGEILWVEHTDGKKMPLNAKPRHGFTQVYDSLFPPRWISAKVYEHHNSTCPKA